MEWLSLAVWIIIIIIGTPLGAAAVMGAWGLGVQVLFAIAGLVFCGLFILGGGAEWLAWGAFAAAILGELAVVGGVSELIDESRSVSMAGSAAEESAAAAAGVQACLYPLAAVLAIGMVAGIVTVS